MAQQKQNNVVLNFKTNGQVQYAQTIKQINMVMSTASKEYQNHILAMGKDAEQTQKLAAEKKKLETQLTASAKKVEMLSKEFEEMQNSTTATADDLQKLYTKLLAAENEHTKLEQSMQRVTDGLTEEATATRDAKGELKQYVDEMKVLEAEQRKLSSAFDLQNASLSHTADEAEKAALKQRQYAQQVEHTERYVDSLSKQLDAAKRAYGDNSKEVNQLEAKLNAAKATVAKFGQELESIDDSANVAERGLSNLETAISGLAGVAAGVSLAKIFEESLNVSDLNNRIDIAFNVDESSKEAVRGILADVQKYGVSAEEAFEGLRRQFALNGEAADEVNGKVVEGAAAITKAYNRVDFVELIQEVNEVAGELEIADQEALNLVHTLLNMGFPDEQIDTIAEYGQQLKRAGYEANEIKAIMASAVATDSWNIDVLLDGLKEGRVKAVEMGNGLSEGFKDTIAQVTNKTQKLSDEQLKQMENGFSDQEKALEKSLSNREKALSKSHDKQQKALDKSLSNETKAIEKSLNEQSKALEKSHDRKLKMLDAEYMAKLKVIDEERYNAIKAIEDEIKALEGLTDAENKAAEAAENAEKRAELQKKVDTAKTKKNRENAATELAKFDEELRIKALQDERKERIDVLKDEKDNIKDTFDEKKDALKSEYDAKKDQLKEINEAEKEALNEQQSLQKEALQERQNMQKDALRERLSAEMEATREAHANELESFRKMNDEKLEIAKNPPDSALYTQTIQQLENWGKAIAQGGEAGSQAYEDMAKWLDSIEDATLRNIIGTELYGTKWEDQGDNIIDTILGMDDALVELENSTQDVNDMIEKVGEENGLVKFQDAIQQTKVALDPLFGLLGDVIGAFATFAAEHPKITAFFVSLIGFIGILAGAFAGLAPIIFTITSLFGAGAGGAGLAGVIGKVVPVITNLATKVLPLLGRAFSLLSGPIGWLILIVPLIIEHWDSISEFFTDLLDGLIDMFKTFGSGIVDFFKEWGPEILLLLTGPIGMAAKFVYDNWEQIRKTTVEKLSNARDAAKEIVQKIRDNTVGKIDDMKKSAVKTFEDLKDGIVKPIELARDAIKKIIDTIKSFFDFSFEWPELKMPKLEIKKGSLNPLEWFSEGLPEFDIKWHAKGGIMTRPTIFGASGNTLFGGGEAGDEAILPLNDKVLGKIGEAIAATMNLNGAQGDVVVNLTAELDGAVVAKKTARYMNREQYREYEKDKRGGG